MKTIPLTPDTEALARRLIWFENPAEALADTVRFAAYAFARATHEDMKIVRAFMSDDDLRGARQGASRNHRPAVLGLLEFAARAISRTTFAATSIDLTNRVFVSHR